MKKMVCVFMILCLFVGGLQWYAQASDVPAEQVLIQDSELEKEFAQLEIKINEVKARLDRFKQLLVVYGKPIQSGQSQIDRKKAMALKALLNNIKKDEKAYKSLSLQYAALQERKN